SYAAWKLARRVRQSRVESIAQLDKALDTGGLLMTLVERPDPAWAKMLPQAEIVWQESLPKLRPKRFASYLALPLVFAIGSAFVPLRAATMSSVDRNRAARDATRQLDEFLEALNASSMLDKEERKQLKEEIAKLAEEAENSPLTQEKWEAVDALQERMQS